MLKQLQMVQSMRVASRMIGSVSQKRGTEPHRLYEPCIVLLSPVLQIFQVVDERRLIEYILLGKGVQIVGICE